MLIAVGVEALFYSPHDGLGASGGLLYSIAAAVVLALITWSLLKKHAENPSEKDRLFYGFAFTLFSIGWYVLFGNLILMILPD